MKNIVKYMMAAAVMTATFPVLAQNLPEGVYEEPVDAQGKSKGIAYKKSATLKPGTTDTYTIDLEAFVTGSVTVKNTSVPADIVLVLDVSGSMDDYMYRATESKNWTPNNLGSTNTYYYQYNGAYYEVSIYDNRLIFGPVGYDYYYLGNNYGQSYNGELYIRGEKKIDALKTAVKGFINEIQRNDLYDDDGNRRKDKDGNDTTLGNQISIVKFAMNRYYNSNAGYNSDKAPITEGDDDYYYSSSVPDANYTQVVQGFTLTGTDSNVQDLKDAVDGLHAAGATAADYGMNLARLLIKSLPTSGDNDRSGSAKTVVFFTDGSPTYGSTYESSVASNTISNAYTLKSTYKANVFSIGVFDSISDDLENYMKYVSSNYPDARNMSQPGNPVSTDASKLVYYQNASGADLSSVFQTIAESSGGSGNTDVAEGSVVTVDVVASSFSLPEGVTADDITVKVAPCEGKKSITWENEDGETITKDYLTFGEAKEATQYGLSAITPTVDASKRTVSTTGFDFSKNWCGYNESEKKYQGYKQIISFEIKVNEDAVGGPNVATNEKESGIYVDGKQIAEFNRPHVPIPVSIWIMKQGLLGDDSAVFTIRYAPYQKGVDPTTITDWKSFTKVMISKDSPLYAPDPEHPEKKYPMEKLVGLDPNFFYKIDEDKWAWSYDYQDNGTQYTVGENLVNPFKFTNTPKDTVREAEATVRNVFAKKSTE